MRKLQIADAQVMQVAIRQEIARSEESRYDHRLHGVLLVATGQSANHVAEVFGEDARTVQRWVRRFEAIGFEGLREGERPGRPRSLDARQWRQLERDLRRSPREYGYAAGTRSSSAYASVSGYSGKWGSAYANPDRKSLSRTLHGSRR
jgi:transposase